MAQRNYQAKTTKPMTVEEVAVGLGVYPLEAFDFVQRGLQYTSSQVYGAKGGTKGTRHVSGQQLADGLRDFAYMQWGLLARSVLAKWNITTTYDFGRIVFALIEGGILQKTEEDTIEDFRNVFDFATLDERYHLESKL
jgi:uncharacterized repeat protein (TIGR04138 family)